MCVLVRHDDRLRRSTQGMFLVMDADMLLLVGNDPSLVKGYRRAVLTPNVVEFKRLSEQIVSRSKLFHEWP